MSLRVIKNPVAVDLAVAGQGARRLAIYLAEHQAHAWRRQDVEDLFEHDDVFLPAKDPDTGEVMLLNRNLVSWVALPAEETESLDDEHALLHDLAREVRVDLAHGPALAGQLLFSVAAGGPRVRDHLNASGRFLKLWHRDRLYLINKAAVVGVTELPTPSPGAERERA